MLFGFDQIPVRLVPQAVQIEPPEEPVPVGVVPLRAPDQPGGIVDPGSRRERPRDAPAHVQHSLVHVVGFRILEQEAVPEAPAHKRLKGGQPAQTVQLGPPVLQRLRRVGRQGPFHQLIIGGRRQIHPACRRMRVQIFAERPQPEPLGILLEQAEEPFQITLFEHPPIGVRPEPELLPIVGVGDGRARTTLTQPRKEGDQFLRHAKRNQVAQILADREDRQGMAFLLGQVIARQRVGVEPGVHEVRVIENRVAEPRRRELLGQPPIPRPLGQPEAAGDRPEPVVQPLREERDLSHRVAVRNHRQDRLVESAAQQLDLIGHHELGEPVQETRLFLLEPLQQRARVVQGQPDARVLLQQIEKGAVAAIIGHAEHVAEIPHRLVVVNAEQERHRMHVTPSTWRLRTCGRER